MKGTWLLVAAGCLAAAPAQAQLTDCQQGPVAYPKVLLDGVRLQSADAGPRTRTFQERVRRRLWLRLKGVPELLAAEGGASFVECPDRLPSGPGDFSVALQDKMLDDGVVLEFWATVDSTSDDEDRPAFEARVQWVSYSLSRSRDITHANRGFFAMPARLSATESSKAIDSLLVPQRVLVAHLMLSLGIEELSGKHYDEAYRRMCMARARLCPDDLELGRSVDGWIRQTVDLARVAGKPILAAELAAPEATACP